MPYENLLLHRIHMVVYTLAFPLVTHAQRNPAGKFSRAAMTLQPRGTVQDPSAVLRADDEIPTKTVIDQHFDLWTAGTNATPDGTMLGGGTVNYALPEDMMGVRGWTGNAVYQAGQACAIRMYLDSYDEQRGGFISTPEMDLSGDVVLTFRARALKAGESGIIRVALCDNYEGPVDDRDFNVSDAWQDYTFSTDQATFNPNNIFQFSAEDVELLLDDIVVTRKANKIPAPGILTPINHSATSFTARWNSTPTAASYLLHVYRKEMPKDYVEPGTLTENFDGIRLNADGKTIDPVHPPTIPRDGRSTSRRRDRKMSIPPRATTARHRSPSVSTRRATRSSRPRRPLPSPRSHSG